jgi:hypothetical protein
MIADDRIYKLYINLMTMMFEMNYQSIKFTIDYLIDMMRCTYICKMRGMQQVVVQGLIHP